MTHLGHFIQTILNEEKIGADALAARCDIDPAVLSRLRTGKRRTCNRATLKKIVSRISLRRIKQAHCLAAYMQDQVFAPYDKRITVAVQ